MSGFPIDRVEIHGTTAPGFEGVRDVFVRNFADDIEIGASFSVVRDGDTVVDLWGGFSDRAATRPWQEDTLVNLYSTSKGLASVAVAIAVAEGKLDYDARVTRYWPEFGAHGKEVLTVGQLLSHQAGVCGPREPITVRDLYDWDKMTTLLAGMEPFWAPGSAPGYHAVVWGYLPGELIRRTTGMSLGQYFRERVAAPMGADCFIGLPDSQMHRVADLVGPNHARIQPPNAPIPEMPKLYPYALQNPIIRPFQDASSRDWRAAEIAAANAQANARGIARIYGALARGGELDGVRIISPTGIAAASRVEVDGQMDLVLGREARLARGFMLNQLTQWGPNPNAFGHNGAGGSIGFADPAARIGVGYTMNQMQPGLETDTRGGRLVRAVYEAVAAL